MFISGTVILVKIKLNILNFYFLTPFYWYLFFQETRDPNSNINIICYKLNYAPHADATRWDGTPIYIKNHGPHNIGQNMLLQLLTIHVLSHNSRKITWN